MTTFNPMCPRCNYETTRETLDACKGLLCPRCPSVCLERQSTITSEEVDVIVKRGMKNAKELEEQLDQVFRLPSYPIILD